VYLPGSMLLSRLVARPFAGLSLTLLVPPAVVGLFEAEAPGLNNSFYLLSTLSSAMTVVEFKLLARLCLDFSKVWTQVHSDSWIGSEHRGTSYSDVVVVHDRSCRLELNSTGPWWHTVHCQEECVVQ